MIQTFDDGSTIDTATGISTPSPRGMLLSDYVAPSSYAPGAKSWLDVLSQGIGHWSAYKIATVQPTTQGQPTAYVNTYGASPAEVANTQNLLKWGLLIAAAVFAVKAMGKG